MAHRHNDALLQGAGFQGFTDAMAKSWAVCWEDTAGPGNHSEEVYIGKPQAKTWVVWTRSWDAVQAPQSHFTQRAAMADAAQRCQAHGLHQPRTTRRRR